MSFALVLVAVVQPGCSRRRKNTIGLGIECSLVQTLEGIGHWCRLCSTHCRQGCCIEQHYWCRVPGSHVLRLQPFFKLLTQTCPYFSFPENQKHNKGPMLSLPMGSSIIVSGFLLTAAVQCLGGYCAIIIITHKKLLLPTFGIPVLQPQ